jgi:prophage regulatory protein
MPEIYLSDRQIGERFGVHHLTPRRWVREDPTFPRPVKLSPGCTRWKLSEIEAWEALKAGPSAKALADRGQQHELAADPLSACRLFM